MYEVNNDDKVVPIDYLPESSVGAPIPAVIANEHELLLFSTKKELRKDGTVRLSKW